MPPKIERVPSGPKTTLRFELGDRVIVEPENRVGIVIGVRYGEIAYNVRCGSECLRSLSPTRFGAQRARTVGGRSITLAVGFMGWIAASAERPCKSASLTI